MFVDARILQAKEKRKQTVAVCVLEVLYPKSEAKASKGDAKGGKAGGHDGKGTADAQPEPPKKRQRSMLDFASTSTAATAEGRQLPMSPQTASSALPPLRGMDRQYLMVQRSEGSGLLAGLWEFPGNADSQND